MRNESSYKNLFTTYFTRFKAMKKSPGSLVLWDLMLNFSKFSTFFHFQGSYSGFGCMPTVSSGRRRNLVSPAKYCDDLLLGSHPYAALSLSCFLSLEAKSSPICPSWCTYLLLQPCLGTAPLPFSKKIRVYKVFMALQRQLAIFLGHFHFYLYCSETFVDYSWVVWPLRMDLNLITISFLKWCT